jgi:DNA-binding GntR family transcriptional regulator
MSSADSKSSQPRLADTAYERIRADILHCILGPGSEVTEAELAERYDLGKAPIRAALQRLAQEGLVQALPRRGHVIAPITLKDIHDLFELRRLIEPPMTAKAARMIKDADVERLRELTAEGDELGTPFSSPGVEFHLFLMELAGNRRARDVMARVHDQLERVANLRLATSDWDVMVHDHHELIDACERRDAEAAGRISAAHIEGSRRSVIDAILASDAMMSVEIGRG